MIREPVSDTSKAAAGTGYVPAPWRLEGSGLILLLKRHRGARDPRWYAMAGSDELARPGIGVLMFVDYWHSEAGPYRELLFIPGRFRAGDRLRWSITRILVSSKESVAGGRANWGIPKELGDFMLRHDPDGSRRLKVTQDGRPVADLAWRPRGPEVPVSTRLVPATLRTLIQRLDSREFLLAPSARGAMGSARVERLQTDPAMFPAVEPQEVMAAFSVPRFEMSFPPARISPCRR